MNKPIRLYALSTCIHCRNTRRLLDELGVEYECIEVDLVGGAERKAVYAEIEKLNPRFSFPTLQIGDTVIVGFKEQVIREALVK
jgi:glutaredoxin-like protein NrdH